MTSQRVQWLKRKIPLVSRRYGFDPWVRKIPWRRKWEPIPVFLPGKSHGQRSLVGHSPWSCKRVGHDLGTKHQQQNLNTWHLRQRNWRKSANIFGEVSPPWILCDVISFISNSAVLFSALYSRRYGRRWRENDEHNCEYSQQLLVQWGG